MTETIRKERKNFLHTRILGKDLEVSAGGLGCMGMTYGYGTPADKRGELLDLLQHTAAHLCFISKRTE